MKILHIITSLELGGAEKLLTELLPAQIESGHTIELMILSDINAVFKKDLEEKEVKIYTAKYNSKKSPLNIFEINKRIKTGNYDIVHVHLVHAQYWTRMARLLDGNKNRKYLTTEHSTSNRRRNNKILGVIDKFIFNGYDEIVSISNATEKSLYSWIGGEKEKYAVIPNGIDLDIFKGSLSIARDELELEDKDIILMMVSRFHKSKNHKGVIEALEYLPEKYKIVFVGDGTLEEDVKNYAKEKKLESRVRFLGKRRDIPNLLKTADIIIQFSFFEGFGITAVEGMASGKPVIASDVPGLAEVVLGGGIVCPNDSRKLAEAVLRLEDKEIYNYTAEMCLKKSKEYSIEKSAEKYIKLYGEILERK